MSARTILDNLFIEGGTMTVQFTITAEDGHTPLTNANTVLTSLTVTHYEESTRQSINSRKVQSILNVNGGTIDAFGVCTLRLDAADIVTVTDRKSEAHVLRFEWYWGTVIRRDGRHEIEFVVSGLTSVI